MTSYVQRQAQTVRWCVAIGAGYDMTQPPDNRSYVVELLRARGFPTISALADSRPTASLRRLATELPAHSGDAPVSAAVFRRTIAELWREEAESSGPAAIERMARRLLVGELHDALPRGWHTNWTDSHDARATAGVLSMAISAWTEDVGERYRRAADQLFASMINEGEAGRIRAGWLPESADDALLINLFARYWNREDGAAQTWEADTQDMEPLDD